VSYIFILEKRTISTGYNKILRQLNNDRESNCPCYKSKYRSSIRLETSHYLYSEKHELLEASREVIREGVILYYSTCRAL
ncbi:hypothetical protein F5882DRAFT_244153, partial [Hyaloscypha sp. PMI_1271]